jgi:hypothetical protein
LDLPPSRSCRYFREHRLAQTDGYSVQQIADAWFGHD